MLKIEETSEGCVVALAGELTIYQVASLYPQLAPWLEDPRPLQVDLSGLQELDTAGIQLLLFLYRQRHAARLPTGFNHPSDAVASALQLLGLEPLLGEVEVEQGACS